MMPLLLSGQPNGWISIDQIIDKTSRRPKEILGLELPPSEVYVREEPFIFTKADVRSNCGWSPYEGMELFGRIATVVVGGEVVFDNGQVLAELGQGTILYPAPRYK
jgi:dihydroorotase-like cyclic amidohydrolase